MAFIYRVRTVFTGVPGTPWYSNLYFDTSQSTPLSAVTAVQNFWQGIANTMSNQVGFFVEGEVPTINDANGEITSMASIPGGGDAGVITGERVPAAAQGLIRFSTGVYAGGRQISGKCFVPGMTEGFNVDGVLTDAAVAVLNLNASNLINDPDTGFVIWSKTNGSSHAVQGYNVWRQWAMLRSRRD